MSTTSNRYDTLPEKYWLRLDKAVRLLERDVRTLETTTPTGGGGSEPGAGGQLP